ncbi:hypothetical protein KR032_002516 [Drosophila birchii]|nr:hypothetical protein KR032_002516 [Drosophila birchii]
MKPNKNASFDNAMSEDEEAASPAASEEDDELEDEEGEEEEEEEEDEVGEEQQEYKDMQVEENSASEDSVDENKSPDRHPYPTPPPDDKSKMAPLDLLVKSKTTISSTKRKATLINLALMAIENLKERSGSSVKAIMNYLKENGHPWKDEKRQARNMTKALKMGVENGQLVMVKRSFKLTEASKKASMAVEKMKAKKKLAKEKEKEKEKLKKAKAAEKEKQKKKAAKKAEKEAIKAETKKEKPGKPSERKTKPVRLDFNHISIDYITNSNSLPLQVTKKKKTEDGIKDVPPKAKTAASVAARALLDTPTNDKEPAEETGKAKAKAKAKTNSSEAGKHKKPRKSIGTLAQIKTSMPNVKAVKKLVAGKAITMPDDEDIGELSEAQASSTPQAKPQTKRKRKL